MMVRRNGMGVRGNRGEVGYGLVCSGKKQKSSCSWWEIR